ncbi:MAG: BrnA antitoxin family protein [SAR324 cluster bacterium]|nr:BrnA antitoxin family protein [SAR324 cluster bacterium]
MEKQSFPEVVPFDEEERELIESTENDDQWRTVSDIEKRKEELVQMAKETNRKKPITIRLSQADIDALKMIAANEGLPYQTLISSVLHKYSVRMLDV